MNIKFYNTPEPQIFDASILPEKPNFIDYRPDFALMKKLVDKYADKKNLIIIGHGGSVTSTQGMYEAFKSLSKSSVSSKLMYFISTVDPDYISDIKNSAPVEDSLVIAVSKSGETITQIEVLMQFLGYEMLIITGVAGPLAEIAHRLNATQIVHPPIGGRYTGFTEVALLPIALCFGGETDGNVDVQAIWESGQGLLQKYNVDNIAYEAANIFYQLEQSGFVDVFLPVYSEELFLFSKLIIQLCHESFGKDGKGQTYFAHQAPESQHHTNQRFFGGRKNIAGWFISVAKTENNLVTEVPDNLADISLRTQTLKVLDGISLKSLLMIEKDATLEDAKLKNIPAVDMSIEKIDSISVGEFMAFWQLFAVYSSVLRGVNPFDQPQVETSKQISFTKRQQSKGHL